MSDNMEEVEVHFLHQTDLAILVNIDGSEHEGAWLPKSLIEYEDHTSLARGDLITIIAPEWLLEREGLI